VAPPSLARERSFAIVAEYGADGQYLRSVPNPDWVPKVAEGDRELSFYVSEMEAYLAPADADWVGRRLWALTEHWRQPDLPPEIEDIVNGDWVYIIGRYPQWAIQKACERWLDAEQRRPTIAGIRKLCDELVADAQMNLRIARRIRDG